MLAAILAFVLVAILVRGGMRRRRGRDGGELTELLSGAAQAGIITDDQRLRMLEYAAAAKGSRIGLDGAGKLAVLAGFFVVAGVCLLIARNWESIAPTTRIVAFVVLLAGVGEAAIRSRHRSLGLSVPLEVLWLFLPLLGIGLYGQTFQLSGDPVRPGLLWLALTAPIPWLTSRSIAPIIHTLAMVFVLFTGNFVMGPAGVFIGDGGERLVGMLALTGGAGSLTGWAVSIALLAAIAGQSLRLLPPGNRHHCIGVIALWLMCLIVSDTPFRIEHAGALVVAGVALATAWLTALFALDTTAEERAPAVCVWVGAIYVLTFTWHMKDAGGGAVTWTGLAFMFAAVLACLGAAAALPARRLSPVAGWASSAKLLLVAPLLISFVYLAPYAPLVWIAAIALNLYLVVLAVALMTHGSTIHDARQINTGMLILVVVLITRFLDLFGGMLTSGVGFIVAGVLLAAMSWALERTRRRLLAAPKEAAS